ncbi:unnamed protein product, partial [marine sediment metagenome]
MNFDVKELLYEWCLNWTMHVLSIKDFKGKNSKYLPIAEFYYQC